MAAAALAVVATPVVTATAANAATDPSSGRIYSMSLSNKTMWSVVRDGYKDSTTVTAYVDPAYDDNGDSVPMTVSVEVQGANHSINLGSKRLPGEWQQENAQRFTWDGKFANGRVAPKGTYEIAVTTHVDGEDSDTNHTAYRYATVRTGMVTERHGWEWNGTETTSRSHSSSCYIDREIFGSGLELDCWGGRNATVTYVHHIPANARITHQEITGSRGCCSNGRVIKTTTRPNRGVWVGKVQVTGWAKFTVKHVEVDWATSVRR